MVQRSKGKTMKWVTLLKDFKEKVGLTQSPPSAPPPPPPSSSSRDNNNNNAFSASQSSSSSPTRQAPLYISIFYFIFWVYATLSSAVKFEQNEKLMVQWDDFSVVLCCVALALICLYKKNRRQRDVVVVSVFSTVEG